MVAVVDSLNPHTGEQGPHRTFWKQVRDIRKADGNKDDVPVLPLIDLSTGQVQALRWPNIESLNAHVNR